MEPDQPLTEAQRCPLLTEAGRRRLHWMWEHPHAPRYNHQCGDRLTPEGLQRLRAFETGLLTGKKGWGPGEAPEWLGEYADRCLSDVPFYRRRGGSARDFLAIPTCSRPDLAREPWSFVPDSQPVDDLIVYSTSGTTGHPLSVLSHPEVSSMYLPVLKAALATREVTLEGGNERVAIILVCAQSRTFTYASVSSYLGEAGFIKLNLNPNDWRQPDDRVQFLDSCNPEIYSGDPISLQELARLPLRTRPKALVSTSMTLLPGLRSRLEDRFGCPVLDVYSMNESRLIAVATQRGFEILPHDLYLEILDPQGPACPPGVPGEVTVSGGRNPFLPLLRYRTGDFAALEFDGRTPVLTNLAGRQPTLFLTLEGKVLNNIEVSSVLRPFPLSQFRLHQNRDLSLILKIKGDLADSQPLRASLEKLFGPLQKLIIQDLTDDETADGKVMQYSSDLGEIGLAASERSLAYELF